MPDTHVKMNTPTIWAVADIGQKREDWSKITRHRTQSLLEWVAPKGGDKLLQIEHQLIVPHRPHGASFGEQIACHVLETRVIVGVSAELKKWVRFMPFTNCTFLGQASSFQLIRYTQLTLCCMSVQQTSYQRPSPIFYI